MLVDYENNVRNWSYIILLLLYNGVREVVFCVRAVCNSRAILFYLSNVASKINETDFGSSNKAEIRFFDIWKLWILQILLNNNSFNKKGFIDAHEVDKY